MLLEYVSFPHSQSKTFISSPSLNRQTCENFAQLAKRGYYNGVIFHRIIAVRHDESRLLHSPLAYFSSLQRISWFRVAIRLGQVKVVPVYMDKSCTFSRSHQSATSYKYSPYPSFHTTGSEDEIHPELRFTGAGILAMANSGPNTNGSFVRSFVRSHYLPHYPAVPPLTSSSFYPSLLLSTHETLMTVVRDFPLLGSQFFMTLAPTPFLDNKHTIFGRVSSGMRVLQRLGAVGVDAQDRSVFSFHFTSLLFLSLSLRRCLRWLNLIPIKQ